MKLKKLFAAVLAIAVVGALFAGCGSSKGVTTDGSTSMEKVIGALGEAFQTDTGIAFSYNPTGSGSGIKGRRKSRGSGADRPRTRRHCHHRQPGKPRGRP